MAAVRWVASEVEKAKRPIDHDVVRLAYQAALLRAHRNGAAVTALVARWIAGELADNRGNTLVLCSPRTTAPRTRRPAFFLYPMPIGQSTWVRCEREPQAPRKVSWVRWRIRAFTYEHVNSAIGLLAMKAADPSSSDPPLHPSNKE
jgi:hypothetical protein